MAGNRRDRKPRRTPHGSSAIAALLLALLIAGTYAWQQLFATEAETVTDIEFRLCGRPPHSDCVIDGDTFYLGNQSIRIADIDAPETNSANARRSINLDSGLRRAWRPC